MTISQYSKRHFIITLQWPFNDFKVKQILPVGIREGPISVLKQTAKFLEGSNPSPLIV